MSLSVGPARVLGGGRRLAVAAVALYAVMAVGVALPPAAGRLALLSVVGVVTMAVGVRANRTVLVGAAVAIAAGGWALRPALDVGGLGGEAGIGRWVSGLVLGVGLVGAFELARLAVDAGPRHGPVRVEAALRRATAGRFGVVAGLGALGAAVAFTVTGGGRASAPSLFLPLGVAAVAAAIGLVVVLVGATLPPATDAAAARHRGAPDRRGHRPRRRAGPSRRTLVGLVVAGALALPALAALGAVAPVPDGSATPAAEGSTGAPAEVSGEPGPPVRDPLAARDETGEGVRSRWVALGVVAVLAGVALLLAGGERMVSADDLRPDVAPPDDLLVGAPSAPDVRTLPPGEAAAVLEDALGFLRADLEPRLAVRCAYAAVAGGLGRRELRRRPAETELEFLTRQLARLADPSDPAGPGNPPHPAAPPGPGTDRVQDAPGEAGPLPRRAALTRLTELFELARFSDAPITEAMRADALTAVEALLAGAAPSPAGGRDRSRP